MNLRQTKIVTIPEIIFQDKNKLVLEVASGTKSDTYYTVVITRTPPHITCDCISGKIRNYCHHIKQVKGYATAFIKKKIDMDMSFTKKT